MGTLNHRIFIALAILSALHTTLAQSASYTIKISNALPANQLPLSVHCKYPYADAGSHDFKDTKDASWQFGLKDIPVQLTALCTCTFARENLKDVKTFGVIVNDKSDPYRQDCRAAHLNWEVKADGFYFGCGQEPLHKAYSW